MKSQLRLMAALSCGMVGWAVVGRAALLQRVVNDGDRVVLPGNVHPLARPEFDAGRTDGSLPEQRIILALAMGPEKKAALERLLVEQQDPGSPNFHDWLTPEEFGARFGATPDEIGLVTGWLQSHGFAIDKVGKGRAWINFTGTVADVEATFRTEIRDYVVAGDVHHANAADPSVPRALADLVVGVVSLHDFRPEPASHPV
jgi:subtilase family serine protease